MLLFCSYSAVVPGLLHMLVCAVCFQVRQELTEEYEQVKAIMGTLECFKSEKPVDILTLQPEERSEDPTVWPPPTPAEHKCVIMYNINNYQRKYT